MARFLRSATAWAMATLVILGALGQLVRDRSAAWALLMYLPTVPAGLMASAFDAIRSGRALPGPRFLLGGLGLVAAIVAAWPMIGWGPREATDPASEIAVLHWNVLWGGGRHRTPARWASIRRDILDRDADLVVLSEAPPADWLDELVAEMGQGATWVGVENAPTDSQWYRMAVCSRGPLRLVRREPIADGAAMVVEAKVRGRVVRLLVVDGRSNPLKSRTPMLRDVAAACHRARAAGEPFDLLLGDFNSPGRSVGFDAVAAEGYDLASRASIGWRGTFPTPLPLYDIDHVWARRELRGLRSELFTNWASDHRGQVARFGWP